MDEIEEASIDEADALRAGGASRETSSVTRLAEGGGPVFRIRLRFAGPDPRVALREDADLTGPTTPSSCDGSPARRGRRERPLDGNRYAISTEARRSARPSSPRLSAGSGTRSSATCASSRSWD